MGLHTACFCLLGSAVLGNSNWAWAFFWIWILGKEGATEPLGFAPSWNRPVIVKDDYDLQGA
jgi:hypothetical protein